MNYSKTLCDRIRFSKMLSWKRVDNCAVKAYNYAAVYAAKIAQLKGEIIKGRVYETKICVALALV